MIVRHYASMSKISEKPVKFVFKHHSEAHGMMKKEANNRSQRRESKEDAVNELMKEEKKVKNNLGHFLICACHSCAWPC